MITTYAEQPVLTGPDDQPVLDFLASRQRLLIGGEHTNHELAILEADGERGHTAPRHLHRHASETFIVLTGEMLIDVGGQIHQAGAGHVALLPRRLPHTFLVTSDHARYLTLHTPAGFEAFVRDVSEASPRRRDPRPGSPRRPGRQPRYRHHWTRHAPRRTRFRLNDA